MTLLYILQGERWSGSPWLQPGSAVGLAPPPGVPKGIPSTAPPHLSIACTHTICFRFTKFRLIKQPGFASSLPRSDLPVGEKQCKFSFSQAKGRALEYPLGSKATKEENEALNPHHVEQGASRLVVVIPLPSNL